MGNPGLPLAPMFLSVLPVVREISDPPSQYLVNPRAKRTEDVTRQEIFKWPVDTPDVFPPQGGAEHDPLTAVVNSTRVKLTFVVSLGNPFLKLPNFSVKYVSIGSVLREVS